jgi:hypothetical protein
MDLLNTGKTIIFVICIILIVLIILRLMQNYLYTNNDFDLCKNGFSNRYLPINESNNYTGYNKPFYPTNEQGPVDELEYIIPTINSINTINISGEYNPTIEEAINNYTKKDTEIIQRELSNNIYIEGMINRFPVNIYENYANHTINLKSNNRLYYE